MGKLLSAVGEQDAAFGLVGERILVDDHGDLFGLDVAGLDHDTGDFADQDTFLLDGAALSKFDDYLRHSGDPPSG